MKWSNFRFLLWFLVFFASSTVFSRTETSKLYSLSAEAEHFSIANYTDGDITFYLESENAVKTEHRLPAKSVSSYRGTEDDLWFLIYIYSNNGSVEYKLDVGKRYYLEWNPGGTLDIFEMPPR